MTLTWLGLLYLFTVWALLALVAAAAYAGLKWLATR